MGGSLFLFDEFDYDFVHCDAVLEVVYGAQIV
nr:MAG TPA: hypothetical protein [Caudoviricetes sp.]